MSGNSAASSNSSSSSSSSPSAIQFYCDQPEFRDVKFDDVITGPLSREFICIKAGATITKGLSGIGCTKPSEYFSRDELEKYKSIFTLVHADPDPDPIKYKLQVNCFGITIKDIVVKAGDSDNGAQYFYMEPNGPRFSVFSFQCVRIDSAKIDAFKSRVSAIQFYCDQPEFIDVKFDDVITGPLSREFICIKAGTTITKGSPGIGCSKPSEYFSSEELDKYKSIFTLIHADPDPDPIMYKLRVNCYGITIKDIVVKTGDSDRGVQYFYMEPNGPRFSVFWFQYVRIDSAKIDAFKSRVNPLAVAASSAGGKPPNSCKNSICSVQGGSRKKQRKSRKYKSKKHSGRGRKTLRKSIRKTH